MVKYLTGGGGGYKKYRKGVKNLPEQSSKNLKNSKAKPLWELTTSPEKILLVFAGLCLNVRFLNSLATTLPPP